MGDRKEIVVTPIPAAPGWYAHTKGYEEEYGSTFGWTPEDASRGHRAHMEIVDDGKSRVLHGVRREQLPSRATV